MAKGISFEVEGLTFRQLRPVDLADRFAEIQNLRFGFYEQVFERRSPEQVAKFVGRLTAEAWRHPNNSVGTTARTGQTRSNPIVSAAFDEKTDELVGFTYLAENVSSKLEPKLNKLHLPTAVTSRVGEFERRSKIRRNEQYVWGSESVHTGERNGLGTVLLHLGLDLYDQDLRGTWFPWDEETQLKAELTTWGYGWDDGDLLQVSGEREFGPGAYDTYEERWVSTSLADTKGKIINLPGAAEAIIQARKTVAA